MKKMIILLTSFLCVLTLPFAVNATEEEQVPTEEPVVEEVVPTEEPTEEVTPEVEPTVPEEEIVYPCNIVISNIEYGEVTAQVNAGNVGDIVEIYYTPWLLYSLEMIAVNGVALTPNEYGIYSIELVEGDNVITATFVVDDAKLEKVAELLNQAKEGDWKSIFSVSNLMQLISWLITTFCASGFFVVLYKSKKFKTTTMDEVNTNVQKTVDTACSNSITDFLTTFMTDYSKSTTEKLDSMEKSNKVLVRCFILMQENTPESRMAILSELDKLNSDENSNALTTTIKELIKQEVQKQEEKTKELERTLDALQKTTEEEIPHL